jgi:hypothetical protein
VYTNKNFSIAEENEKMASLPKLEKFLFTLSTGLTGLELLKEYGIQSSELQYFINFCKEPHDLSVSAMGPSNLTQRQNERIKVSYSKIVDEMKNFNAQDCSGKDTEKVIQELTDLHDLIGKVYDVSKATAIPF